MKVRSIVRTLNVKSVEDFAVQLNKLLRSGVQITEIWPPTSDQMKVAGVTEIRIVVIETET